MTCTMTVSGCGMFCCDLQWVLWLARVVCLCVCVCSCQEEVSCGSCKPHHWCCDCVYCWTGRHALHFTQSITAFSSACNALISPHVTLSLTCSVKIVWLESFIINDMRHYAMKRHIICESSMPCTLSPLSTITDFLNFTLYCADTVDIMLTYCFQGAPAKAPVPTFLNNYSKYVLWHSVLCLLCGIWSECLVAVFIIGSKSLYGIYLWASWTCFFIITFQNWNLSGWNLEYK